MSKSIAVFYNYSHSWARLSSQIYFINDGPKLKDESLSSLFIDFTLTLGQEYDQYQIHSYRSFGEPWFWRIFVSFCLHLLHLNMLDTYWRLHVPTCTYTRIRSELCINGYILWIDYMYRAHMYSMTRIVRTCKRIQTCSRIILSSSFISFSPSSSSFNELALYSGLYD
jgi:hypothetical protein